MAKILIYSLNVVGKSMAGPAIRCWEFTKALSEEHEVLLITPNSSDLSSSSFRLMTQHDPALKQEMKTADVMIVQSLKFAQACVAKYYGIKIIVDAYDPVPLELLEQFKAQPLEKRYEINNSSVSNLLFSFKAADSIICASEKQRDLWLGFLLGQKSLTPIRYDHDNSLRQYIDVVPFGLSSTPPQKTGLGLREKYNLNASQKIILWGGGIWNWFDPLSLIKAMKIIKQTRQDVKLIFMGIKNPDPHVAEMSMCREAIELSQQLGLTDQDVFFNMGWVPYEERHNFLLDADIGASIHFDHLETRYSFRTRMLDYIWAQLPILATIGDSFAELIEKHQLGLTVPYKDEKAIAKSLLQLLDQPEKIQAIKNNLSDIQKQFYWDRVVDPIRSMIKHLTLKPKTRMQYKDVKTMTTFVLQKVCDKGIKGSVNKAYQMMGIHSRSSSN